jgi:2-amino-4-hydroxy-6-hydroxymethyldihydropteridine diphosphokinase
MPVAYLGIGSNLDAEENIQLAVRELRERFSVQKISTVYRSKALGFAGADFLNMVVSIETKISPTVLCGQLEQIHELAGRRRQSEKFIARTLDIDLLLYDQLVVNEAPVRLPRKDVLQYSFVIAPDYRHPETGKSLLQHWQEFDAAAHALTAVDVAL